MRILLLASTLFLSILCTPLFADEGATTAVYTTAGTTIGVLLDDPAARAIVDKHLPQVTSGSGIDQAREMTLTSIQQFAPDMITAEALAKIDAELAALPAK